MLIVPALAYADDNGKEIRVVDRLNDNTQFLFYYSGENIKLIQLEYGSLGGFPELYFDTSENTDGYFTYKAPKNYPFYSASSPYVGLVFDGNELNGVLWNANSGDDFGSDDCFYESKLFVGNLTRVEIVSGLPLVENLPSDAREVPNHCLQKTIAGYGQVTEKPRDIDGDPDRWTATYGGNGTEQKQTWKNHRGESVTVYLASAGKLFERGYLVQKQ